MLVTKQTRQRIQPIPCVYLLFLMKRESMPEAKKQGVEVSDAEQKTNSVASADKIMASVFWDAKWIH